MSKSKSSKALGHRLNIVRENRFEVIDNATDELVAVYPSKSEASESTFLPFVDGPNDPTDQLYDLDQDQGQERVTRVYAAWRVVGTTEAVAEMIGNVLSQKDEDETGSTQYFGLGDADDEDSDCAGSHYSDGELSLLLHPLGGDRALTRFILVLAGRADGIDRPSITPPLLVDPRVVFEDEVGNTHANSDIDGCCDFGSIKNATSDQALAKGLGEALASECNSRDKAARRKALENEKLRADLVAKREAKGGAQ